MFDIHRTYISVNAPGHLNLGENILLKINKDLKVTLTTTVPKLESIFTNPQQEIESIVAFDIYPRFVRHQLTMSAAKALARWLKVRKLAATQARSASEAAAEPSRSQSKIQNLKSKIGVSIGYDTRRLGNCR